jgi:hypothetical protein
MATTNPVLSIDASKIRDNGMSLNWLSALDSFGDSISPISQYLLYSDVANAVASFSKTQVSGNGHVFKDLEDGITYLVKLAQETTSDGIFFSNTISVRATSISEQPTIASVTGIDNGLTVIVQHGSDGASVMSHITFLLADGLDIFTVVKALTYVSGTPAPSSFTLDTSDNAGIVNGKTFEVASFTTNARGDSPISNAMLGTPSNFPDAPQNLTNSPSASTYANYYDRIMPLTWNHPLDFSEYSSHTTLLYEINYRVVGVTAWSVKSGYLSSLPSPGRQVVIDNLTNGASYEFKVRYLNDNGEGQFSSVLTATPFGKSSPPENVLVIEGDGFLTYNWDPPSNSGGLPVHQYELLLSTGESVVVGDAVSTHTFSGLTNGIAYQLTIIAKTKDSTNVIWESFYSFTDPAFPFTIPTIPTNINTAVSNGSMTVSWDFPISNGGRDISKYEIKVFNVEQSESYIIETFNLSAQVPGLTNGIPYTVEVRARNEAGFSPSSSGIIATPFSAPSPPLNFQANPIDSSVSCQWNPPADTGGFSITEYIVSFVDEFGTSTTEGSITSFTEVFADLINGRAYSFRIKAVTSMANGTWSPTVTVIPFGNPIVNSVVASSKTLTASVSPNGRNILNYHALALDADPSSGETIFKELTVNDLTYQGTVSYTINFNNFSGDIAKYLFFVTTAQGSSIVESTF